MFKSLYSSYLRRMEWVRSMRFYRKRDYSTFLEMIKGIEEQNALTPYQRAVKANALLLSGEYKQALALFSLLTGVDDSTNDIDYIKLYARAMIADVNGDTDTFGRIASSASSLPCRSIVRRNLPLA